MERRFKFILAGLGLLLVFTGFILIQIIAIYSDANMCKPGFRESKNGCTNQPIHILATESAKIARNTFINVAYPEADSICVSINYENMTKPQYSKFEYYCFIVISKRMQIQQDHLESGSQVTKFTNSTFAWVLISKDLETGRQIWTSNFDTNMTMFKNSDPHKYIDYDNDGKTDVIEWYSGNE